MKLLVIFLLATTLVCSDAYRRWHPTSKCIDCYGRRVWPGMRFYDGCNWCRCTGFGRAACTYMNCYWNRCFKKRG